MWLIITILAFLIGMILGYIVGSSEEEDDGPREGW